MKNSRPGPILPIFLPYYLEQHIDPRLGYVDLQGWNGGECCVFLIYFLLYHFFENQPPHISQEFQKNVNMFLAVILFWSCLTLYHFKGVKRCNDIRNSRIRLGGLVKIAEIRLISAYPCTLAMRGVEASRLALGNIAVLKGVPGSHLCDVSRLLSS